MYHPSGILERSQGFVLSCTQVGVPHSTALGLGPSSTPEGLPFTLLLLCLVSGVRYEAPSCTAGMKHFEWKGPTATFQHAHSLWENSGVHYLHKLAMCSFNPTLRVNPGGVTNSRLQRRPGNVQRPQKHSTQAVEWI